MNKKQLPYQFIIIRSFAVYLVAFIIIHLIWWLSGIYEEYRQFLSVLNASLTAFLILNVLSYLLCLFIKRIFPSSSLYKVTILSALVNSTIITAFLLISSEHEDLDLMIIMGLFYLVVIELPRAGVIANLNEKLTLKIQLFITGNLKRILITIAVVSILLVIPEFPEIHFGYSLMIFMNNLLILIIVSYFIFKLGSQRIKKEFISVLKIEVGLWLILFAYSTSLYFIYKI